MEYSEFVNIVKENTQFPINGKLILDAAEKYYNSRNSGNAPVSSSADLDEDDYSDEDEFQPCSRCDGHDACADYGCAIEQGLGHLVHQEPGSDGVF